MKLERLTRNASDRLMHAIVLSLFCALAAIAAPAQTFTSLLNFVYTNGSGPESLVRGFDGNFYGVTWAGGNNTINGSVFRITPGGYQTVLYNFCVQSFYCTNGANPQSLMVARDGSLYGTTASGGDPNNCACGVVFKITPSGALTVLYSMTSTSGSMPWRLIEGNNGNLYGIAYNGGAHSYGTLFELTPAGQFNLLHSFCSLSNCADGSWPIALVQTADGTLYGATEGGGTKGLGTLYSLSPSGTFTTLHNFTGKDGSTPYNLILGADANLYGTTNGGGGNGQCVPSGCGTIFRFNRAGQLAKLYTFCSQSNCTDGVIPTTLLQASDGSLYGATSQGGDLSCGAYYKIGCGTLFQLTSTGTLNTLHTFELTDGQIPNVLLQDTDGSFYGATLDGGDMNAIDCTSYGCGTVFNLSTGLAPFVTLTRNSGRVGQTGGVLGRGLTGTTGVFLNGTPATFTVLSDTVIEATVPAGATSGFVTVQTPSGTLSSNVQFQVTQ